MYRGADQDRNDVNGDKGVEMTNMVDEVFKDESDRRLISCIGKFFKPLDSIIRVAGLASNCYITSTSWKFF